MTLNIFCLFGLKAFEQAYMYQCHIISQQEPHICFVCVVCCDFNSSWNLWRCAWLTVLNLCVRFWLIVLKCWICNFFFPTLLMSMHYSACVHYLFKWNTCWVYYYININTIAILPSSMSSYWKHIFFTHCKGCCIALFITKKKSKPYYNILWEGVCRKRQPKCAGSEHMSEVTALLLHLQRYVTFTSLSLEYCHTASWLYILYATRHAFPCLSIE